MRIIIKSPQMYARGKEREKKFQVHALDRNKINYYYNGIKLFFSSSSLLHTLIDS